MEVFEALGAILALLFILALFVFLIMMFIYTIKLMSILPECLQKITDSIERLSKK